MRQLNKEKTIFTLALALLGFTGYRIADNLFIDRTLPSDPRADRGDLREADPELVGDVEPVAYARFAGFGARNPFQLPRAQLKAQGYFVMHESDGRPQISGRYRFTAEGKVDRVQISLPRHWTASAAGEGIKLAATTIEGATRTATFTFAEIQEGRFELPMSFALDRRSSHGEIAFPEIRTIDTVEESGYIGVRGSKTHYFVPEPGAGLEAATRTPRELGHVEKAFRYERHPYTLSLKMQRKPATVATKPPDGVKPPVVKPPLVKPPLVKPPGVKPPVDPVEPDNGGEDVAEKPFEVPFSFNATITVGRKYAVLQDKATGALKRCSIGDSLDGLKVVDIYSTSVLLEDEQGVRHELIDSTREKYD